MASHDETPDPLADLREAIDQITGTPLVQVATRLHEMFLALQAGGFTEDQALRLTVLLVHRTAETDTED